MAGPTPTAPGGNSTGQGASRGGTGPSFTARKFANEQQMRIYAASLCGLIAVFILFHWTRWLCARIERSMKSGGKSALGLPFVRASRWVSCPFTARSSGVADMTAQTGPKHSRTKGSRIQLGRPCSPRDNLCHYQSHRHLHQPGRQQHHELCLEICCVSHSSQIHLARINK
jgi:hypothetical protein